VMLGVVEMLKLVTGPGDAVVVNPPVYPPFFPFVEHMDRRVLQAPLGTDRRIDLGTLEETFRQAVAGGRRAAYLLCSPHNPTGTVHTAEELAAVAALADGYGVRVVADEIHAPLVLSGAAFTPYLTVDDRAIVVTSGSKAFNMPATHTALLVLPDPADRERLAAAPIPAQNTWSSLGVVAGTVGWRDCDAWLDALRRRLGTQRELLVELVADRLPKARMRPLEATYLAWLDLRGYGVADPAAAALAHGVRVAPGQDYQPGLGGHVRVNIATSPDRLERVVDGLASALAD
jgi:cysteine-S-conjugate beta-lyase